MREYTVQIFWFYSTVHSSTLCSSSRIAARMISSSFMHPLWQGQSPEQRNAEQNKQNTQRFDLNDSDPHIVSFPYSGFQCTDAEAEVSFRAWRS